MTPPTTRLGAWTRIGLAGIGIGLVAVLGLARSLEPDPRGFGTHEQLGLRPCAFRSSAGVSCPSCGMTTAFSEAVRGRLGRSWRANPAGCLIAAASPLLAAWLFGTAASGRTRSTRSVWGPPAGAAVAAVAAGLLAWCVRIYWQGSGQG